MASPAMKRFNQQYVPIADAIARLEIDQEVREAVAEAVADGIEAATVGTSRRAANPDFIRDTFVLLASDPLVPCAGYQDKPCPHGRELRVAMHLSSAPDGRSKAWQREHPSGIRCVSCGAATFVEGYAENNPVYSGI